MKICLIFLKICDFAQKVPREIVHNDYEILKIEQRYLSFYQKHGKIKKNNSKI